MPRRVSICCMSRALPLLLFLTRTRTAGAHHTLTPQRKHTTPPPLDGAATAQVEFLGELASVPKPLTLPVEDVYRDDDDDG